MLPNDEPAFPRNYDADGHNGMTLLDYFAAKALPSIINLCRHDTLDDNKSLVDHFAGNAYAMAHAMLAAREVTK